MECYGQFLPLIVWAGVDQFSNTSQIGNFPGWAGLTSDTYCVARKLELLQNKILEPKINSQQNCQFEG